MLARLGGRVCIRLEKDLVYSVVVSCRLSESGRAATHDLSLTNELCIEFGTIEGKVNIKVNTVESPLRGIHPLKVLFEVLSRKVRSQGDNFLYTYTCC